LISGVDLIHGGGEKDLMNVVQICLRDDRGRRACVVRCGLLVIIEERDH